MQVLILGGSSDIGLAVSRIFAKNEKTNIYLASRNISLLEKKADDLRLRYNVNAIALEFDVTNYSSHINFYNKLEPKPDIVVCTFGYMGDQNSSQEDFQQVIKIIESNYLGGMSILNIVANDFEKRKSGTIICISSVAGERGRKSNYIYGSSKSALSTYMEGLRHRLFEHGVRVITVLPGFVNTKMTENIELNQMLTAEVDEVASDIFDAYKKRKNKIYTKWFWKYIMFIVRNIPERIFLKTNL